MIYLDNAATTYPKPQSVRLQTQNSFLYSANPGRSGHKLSIKAAETIYNCRQKLADFFHCDNPEHVILTSSCTFSLNTVIKGVIEKGDHAVISSLEHNSVLRPMESLKSKGILTYSVAEVYEEDDDVTVDSFRKAIKPNTKLVVCTHASNVFGIKLPIEKIAALCRFYGILFCVDAAQTAGVADINVTDLGADYICLPGHKGLYGPMGTGALIINSEKIPDSFCEGGTGSGSLSFSQPLILPDKFESGTMNLHGIAGLSSGIDFVSRKTPQAIYKHEMKLIESLYNGLKKNNKVILYTNYPSFDRHMPLLSFNVADMLSEDVAQLLDSKFGIAVRAGLHCSPLAHRQFSTEDGGTVRVSPSVFTSPSDVDNLLKAVKIISDSKKIPN
ncbi:MAG: aminotransferase class V-fold PLP-dependent enzyme [Ruminococcus sp.]